MAPNDPNDLETTAKTTQDIITPAQKTQQTSDRGKDKARPGRTTKQARNGPNSSNSNHGDPGDPSTQATHQQQPFHKPNSKTIFQRNSRPGNNSTHNTATSTRPSFLNSQWRTYSTQQTTTADTEDLTQAMEQLTTKDNSEDTTTTTTTTTGPTTSRWRTTRAAKQPPANSTTTDTAPIPTRTRSHNPNAKASKPRTTPAAQPQQGLQPSPRQKGGNPRLYVLPRPTPSASYLEQAQLPPRRLSNPKKLLIVLDLNGTLLVRSNRGSNYTPRPHVDEFLAYCLEHHALIVWSSARLQNVTAMVAQLFTAEQRQKLVKIWSRNELRLGKYFDAKVQVYKQLTWLWEDSEVQASFPMPATLPFRFEDGWKDSLPTKWDQSNTVLLDDSVDKAASEPHNLLQVDEFTKENIGDGEDALGRVLAYIEALKWEADVSAAMRARPFVNGQGEVWNWGTVERPPSA